MKQKTKNFFTTIGIPGIPMIAVTDIYFFKFIWTLLILTSVGFGVYSVYETTIDYYNFDVITNVERVSPGNATYPAITICNEWYYQRDYYKDQKLNATRLLHIKDSRSRIKNFIGQARYSGEFLNSTKLDYFKVLDHLNTRENNFYYDCVRFNGATDKNVELVKAYNSLNIFSLRINNHYIDHISNSEYFNYSLVNSTFKVFVADNYLNSFEKVQSLVFERNFALHSIKMEIASTEIKLGEPYSQCKDSSAEKPFHQMNCMETCIYTRIKDSYNCTFDSLFAVEGLQECRGPFNKLKGEFSADCQKICPIGCYSKLYDYNNFNTIEKKHDYTQFEFSIPDFSLLVITQIPKMNGFSFICSIGGALGLFMGTSFLNIIELIEFIIDISSVFF